MSKKLNYDELYEKYRKLVYQIALKYSQADWDLANDVAQEVFIKLYQNIDTMRHDNLVSWLITVTKNQALNELEKRKRLVFASEIENPDEVMPITLDVELNYLQKEAKREEAYLCREIFKALEKKNPRWYMAMDECYRMGMPRVVVADHMGITVNVLDSLLHRGKEWVNKEFGVTFKETRQD